ncbi:MULTISPECIES: hypothetical protein [Sphingomonadaceae]|jgi:hypothetical protein|uniref:hypothetical protein n=1 Tax=Sphingomonadaceae TaxID=41297 RepID=UPI000AA11AFC|nr:hypothetical protein [Novosphingobium sp. B1]
MMDDADRAAYATGVLRTGSRIEGRRWYQDNTLEPIRDETLREGSVHSFMNRQSVLSSINHAITVSMRHVGALKAHRGKI